MRVSVIGGGVVDERTYDVARNVGTEIASRGHDLVCGGLGGVMEAACRGAREAGGHTIGILPGDDRRRANDYVETAVATGLGNARNVLVVLNGDAVVAVNGGPGTLSEVGHALDFDRPIAGIDSHDVPGVEAVATPAKAVAFVERAVS